MNEIPKLQRVTRLDSIKVDETYYTSEGFLIDHPIVTTVGIFEYMNPDGSIRRELRLGNYFNSCVRNLNDCGHFGVLLLLR